MNPITDVIGAVGKVIDKFVPDANQKVEANLELTRIQLDADAKFAQAERDVLVAEAQSESWLTRNWRPMIMLTFGYIIFHNYIIAQLFSLKLLDITPDMWALLKIGIGGYVMGRSVEKAVESYSSKQ